MYDLEGKVALVTGAGGQFGIGRAVATRLAQEGASVAVNDLIANPYPKDAWHGLESVAQEIKDMGRDSLVAVADVTSEEDVGRMVDDAISHFGHIDILVTSHGSKPGKDRRVIVELEVKEWEKEFDVNAKGSFLCSRAVARHMIAEGIPGNIVHIASTSGKNAGAQKAAYCSSKAATIKFSQCLSLELAQYRIRVNSICPAGVDSERTGLLEAAYSTKPMSTENWMESEGHAKMVEGKKTIVPLGRIAQGADIANTVAFLTSNESDYLTGLSVNVAGGSELDQ